MESLNHPDNTSNSNEWSESNLQNALKLRQIWKDTLAQENEKIRNILQNAWFPYFALIRNYLKNLKDGYELESTIFVAERPTLKLPINRIMEPYVEVTFYLLPELTDDDVEKDKEFEIIPIEFNKKQETYIKKLMLKFSEEIKMSVVLLYE
jgi:hypothetical protein